MINYWRKVQCNCNRRYNMEGKYARLWEDLIKFDLQWEKNSELARYWNYEYIWYNLPYYVDWIEQGNTRYIWKLKKQKVEEMTLEEICNKLGKEIKIIK